MLKNKDRFYLDEKDVQEVKDLINKVECAARIEGRM